MAPPFGSPPSSAGGVVQDGDGHDGVELAVVDHLRVLAVVVVALEHDLVAGGDGRAWRAHRHLGDVRTAVAVLHAATAVVHAPAFGVDELGLGAVAGHRVTELPAVVLHD